MKTLFTLIALWVNLFMVAQNFMYTHLNTADNTVGALARLDHPMLNGNPDAKFIVTHNWEPFNVYNNHVTGTIYNESTDVWFLVNEDGVPMLENASYNIYIAQEDEVIVHQATLANQGVTANVTLIDNPLLNNNIGRLVLITNYRQGPDFIVNDNNYGVYYNDIADRRGIFSQDGLAIPEDASFFVYISGVQQNVGTFRHQASADNTVGNYTLIDNSLLNNNPDAIFVASHYFGVLPGSSENNDAVIGVWYDDSTDRWSVYNEDLSAMPEGIVFDLIIYDPALSVEEQILQRIALAPNPAGNFITLTTPDSVEVNEVQVFNIMGQLVKDLKFEEVSSTREIEISGLNSGAYIMNITTDSGTVSRKFIKE